MAPPRDSANPAEEPAADAPRGSSEAAFDPRSLPEFDSSEEFEGIDIDILQDGTVRLHAACQPGQDPEECRQRIHFLVDALGLPLDGVVTEISDGSEADAEPDAEADATGGDADP